MSAHPSPVIRIFFTDFWNVYDATHSRWYEEITIVVQVNGADEILIDLRYRKTQQGEFFFLVGQQGISLEYESFSDNATRVVRFPPSLSPFTSLEEILHHKYLPLQLPTEVLESRITRIRQEWDTSFQFTRVRPDVDPVYQWQD